MRLSQTDATSVCLLQNRSQMYMQDGFSSCRSRMRSVCLCCCFLSISISSHFSNQCDLFRSEIIFGSFLFQMAALVNRVTALVPKVALRKSPLPSAFVNEVNSISAVARYGQSKLARFWHFARVELRPPMPSEFRSSSTRSTTDR